MKRLDTFLEYKRQGKPWAMSTAYDYASATAITNGGIECLLVGDSAANVVLGYPTTNRVSFEEMSMLCAAVVRGAQDAFVIADLPFGSYEASDELAVLSATRMVRETGCHAVKLEGGVRMASRIRAITEAGVVVCAHLGFTPQSLDQLSGFKVQGRGGGAQRLEQDLQAVIEAGAAMVVFEMIPAHLAERLTEQSPIPTIGIGAGPHTDAQVLVWHDYADYPGGSRTPRFVEQFGHVGEELTQAAQRYREAVESGRFPTNQHTFEQ